MTMTARVRLGVVGAGRVGAVVSAGLRAEGHDVVAAAGQAVHEAVQRQFDAATDTRAEGAHGCGGDQDAERC